MIIMKKLLTNYPEYYPKMIVFDEDWDLVFNHKGYDQNKCISTFVDIYGKNNKQIACLKLKKEQL
jgi:hypothetical protein